MQNISFEGLTWIVKTLERVLMSAASKNFSEARPVPCAKKLFHQATWHFHPDRQRID
jgi:hypothetical protein